MEEHGWLILIAAAIMLGGMTLWEMRRLAPRFTGLQLRLSGYDTEIIAFLKDLGGDAGQLDRVNRVRKLDLRVPAILGFVFIAANLLFAGDPATARMIPYFIPALQVLGIGTTVIALVGDYLENIQLGRMIDALPALPDDARVLKASRTTIVKLWAYIAAVVIAAPQLLVYLYLKIF
ncbi:hypothetical protein IHQ71_01535 [Rhizobium sp. TH2]|uniref:hypothetical protein n=1 Tax=Rhizobium sp. TH2 TaxID=2775403 RepID=UPI0021574240|nr:hypothetical protein [Rhizobium sp. TH2]UVC09339.1 hypothetical protein IHQ71_01535 [Rhizobium sp. TH2]